MSRQGGFSTLLLVTVMSLASLMVVYAEADAETCWPVGTSPAPNSDLKGSMCCWYSSNTCCTSDVTSSADFASMKSEFENLLKQLNNTVNDCYLTIADLACSFCSPNTSQFLVGMPGDTRITVCESFCSSLFKSCGSYASALGIVTNSSTSDIQFCQAVFDQVNNQTDAISIYITTSNQNCFGGVGNEDLIKNAGCLPGTEKKGKGAIIAVVIILFVILAGVGAFFFIRWRNRRAANIGRGTAGTWERMFD
eukprot:TRINITY_DN2568_c0_g1_i3.p1 TRINITY_DN2568_c0_g1~~TRINITY_DN2568_c0_g1_i3.p1  ORF type:complete len:251 (-),score=42.51 TRINITY_DN2568_c0_g1_i3:143-895(-)